MYLIMHELFIVYVHDTDIESTEHIYYLTIRLQNYLIFVHVKINLLFICDVCNIVV
jgi:hypothetical protein